MNSLKLEDEFGELSIKCIKDNLKELSLNSKSGI